MFNNIPNTKRSGGLRHVGSLVILVARIGRLVKTISVAGALQPPTYGLTIALLPLAHAVHGMR
jgi:hypothetical protein